MGRSWSKVVSWGFGVDLEGEEWGRSRGSHDVDQAFTLRNSNTEIDPKANVQISPR